MKKILYISMMMPYQKVNHAGGKSFYYYINRFAEDVQTEVTLIAKVLPEEEKFVKTINPQIRFYPVRTPNKWIEKILCYAKSINSKLNPWYPYGNVLTKEIFDQMEAHLKQLKAKGYRPDIVILEWTWMMLWVKVVKKYFPDAKYVATEHDVSFLGYQRKAERASGPFKKALAEVRYRNVKRREVTAAQICDYVVTLNEKDRKLLLGEGVAREKTGVIAPFFTKPTNIQRKPNGKDILFFGAMNRPENALSAVWFVEKVMPLLTDMDLRFVILGGNPSDEVKNLQSERVVVTGFVDDVQPYFESAVCMAAPLLLGAGIKIKVLEALAMGLPVITNDIGIEGIDAVDGVHYLHCSMPEQYAAVIRQAMTGERDLELIGKNALKFIQTTFDFEKSFSNYNASLNRLCGREQL